MGLTQSDVLTEEFVDLLAMELIPRQDDVYRFYQSGPIKLLTEAGEPGKVILFNRPILPTGDYDEVSRRGTEGVDIPDESQSIGMDQVAATIREYLGPHDGTGIRPFGITEFMAKRSRHDLLTQIGSYLRLDRVRFLNTVIRNQLLAAPLVVTGDGLAEGLTIEGPADADWLRRLGKAMSDALIPTYPNGRYRLWITTQQAIELKSDAEYREATRYLGTMNPAFSGQISYFDKFDIGEDTTIPTKNVGPGGAYVAQQALAHGPLGLGHGVAMEPVPAKDPRTDFGRRERVIWKSHETFVTLTPDLLARGITISA